MLLATESIKVRTVAASSMMPEVPRCALNNALEDAARSREASLDADRKALGLVQRMAWPTTESCRWAQQLVERVVASSSRLQAATEATERAVLIAHEAHASEGRKQLDVEILRGRGVLKERDAVDTVWRREMRAMETSQRSEVLQMRSEWQAGTSRLRSRAAFESKEQRLETAEHISRITSLQVCTLLHNKRLHKRLHPPPLIMLPPSSTIAPALSSTKLALQKRQRSGRRAAAAQQLLLWALGHD